MLVTGLLKSFYILCGTLSAVKYEKRMRKGAMLLIFLKKIEETSRSSTHNHRCLHRFPGSNFVSNCSILLFSLQMRYKGRPPLGTGSWWKWRPRQAQILREYKRESSAGLLLFPGKVNKCVEEVTSRYSPTPSVSLGFSHLSVWPQSCRTFRRRRHRRPPRLRQRRRTTPCRGGRPPPAGTAVWRCNLPLRKSRWTWRWVLWLSSRLQKKLDFSV